MEQPLCYLLRLPCFHIPYSSMALDIQIYNSRLKQNTPLCMFNHSTKEIWSSFIPKSG